MQLKRIVMSFVGVIITAFSVGAFKFSAFGVDPFQSFMTGIDSLFPLSFGTLYVIVNALLLLFALIFDRHYIGIATMLNLFLLGYIVDFSQSWLRELFPDPSILLRTVFFLLGFLFLCFGSSLYMTADLGVSTYDAIALIVSKKWKLGHFRVVRMISDTACILIGAILLLVSGNDVSHLTASIGIGTIITALCMGPFVDWFHRKLSKRMGNARSM